MAFVLSSGANLGAAQVGMLRALIDHDIYPDLVVGASVGAINGAALAEEPSLEGIARLERVWRTLDPRDLLPRGRMVSAVALARRGQAVHSPDGLRETVQRAFSSASFEDLKTPFQCVATDVVTAREAWFDSGPLAEAVLASTAMPAVYPAVEIDGRRYVDGGVVVDVPLRRAAELGARTLYVLGLARLSRPWSEPRRPLDAAIEAYWVARRHRFQRDLESLPDGVTVHLLTDEVPPRLRFSDVAYTAELIESGHNTTAAYLDQIAAVAPLPAPSRPGVPPLPGWVGWSGPAGSPAAATGSSPIAGSPDPGESTESAEWPEPAGAIEAVPPVDGG